MSDDIVFEQSGDWGIARLNREKALNALNWDMVKALYAQLQVWRDKDDVKAVMIEAAGDRAFCAGGDIRWLYENGKIDPAGTCEFFREEYINNSCIHHYPKPFLALIDGLTLGGGIGVSIHGKFRVAGDKTTIAMPETGIGLFPDIGGGYFMPRMPDGLGLYYALTGARAKSADALKAGYATHYTPSDQQDALRAALLAQPLSENAESDIEAVLAEFKGDPGPAPIDEIRDDIARLFVGHDTYQSLIAGLQAAGSAFAEQTLNTLSQMSPTSLLITFEQMKRGASLNLNEVLQMEFRMVWRAMHDHDFFEGVRAQIIDKDRNPNWQPASINDVPDGLIENYFEPLDASEELTFS